LYTNFVVDYFPVDVMHLVQLAQIKTARSLDEMCLGGMGVWITERGYDNGREMDELSVNF
jgi:hypothetical protein